MAQRAQRSDPNPCHEDLYAWGWALSDLSAHLASVAVLLEHQVSDYPARWVLRDDAGMDPELRISRCACHLAELAGALGTAGQLARPYHNEMSHVAVDHDREVQ